MLDDAHDDDDDDADDDAHDDDDDDHGDHADDDLDWGNALAKKKSVNDNSDSSSWAINYTYAQAKPQQENQPATFGIFYIFKVNLLPRPIL